MKIRIVITILLLPFVLASCASAATAIPTETVIAKSTFTPAPFVNTQVPKPSATAFVSSYPPCAPPYTSSLPVSAHVLQLNISNGLTLEEYHGTPDIEEQESGCRYAFRDRAHIMEIALNNSFRVINMPIKDQKEEIVVLSGGEQVFETQISPYVYSGLLEAWEYDNHWVIEFVTIDSDIMRDGVPPKNDIIGIVRDGVSLKEENNYQAAFGFQLLAGKPFYFFKKYDNTFGANYNGHEIIMDYDNIPYDNPHPGLDRSVIQYQNMVLFSAEKDGVWRSVVIGAFNK